MYHMLKKKKALVLSGGGTRGAYENGAVRALCELGEDDWGLVTGTSIGALNGAVIVQKDYEALSGLWDSLKKEDVINGDVPNDFTWESLFNNVGMRVLFKQYVHGGTDVSPMLELIGRMFDPDAFLASPVDFGCVTVQFPTLRPVYVTKDMMREDGLDWLVASASAYPVFPVHRFAKGEFIDGGYYDNLPVDEALRMGAEEVIAVDLHHRPQHPQLMDRTPVTYICPTIETGTFLNFDRDKLNTLDICGYYDVMKVYGRYSGYAYTFEKTSLPDWFEDYERKLILLENNAARSGAVSDLLRSDQPVYDRIRERQNRKVLSRENLFFGLMDELMSLCGCDVKKVWDYRTAVDTVLAAYAPCAYEDYELDASLANVDLRNYFGRSDTGKIVGSLVHMSLYPEHTVISPRSVYALYPYEKALADFVVKLMYELGRHR